MQKFINKIFRPVVPVLYVDSNINQANCYKLISKIGPQQFLFAKALAIVVSIQNSMPVQIDKIVEKIKIIKKQFNIPVYAFCLDQCTSQSYYMISIADEIYALQSTVFQLKGNQSKIQLEILSNYGIKKTIHKSNQNTKSTFFDSFSAANTSYYMNKKSTNISERLFKYSIENRFFGKKDSAKQSQLYQKYQKISNGIIGKTALQEGLIDNIGSYCDILNMKHPECQLKIIKLKDEPIQIKKSIGLLTSPLLLLLFMFKVFLKYSFLMYLYLKSKTQKKSQQQVANSTTGS